ncbi:TonB-dependent receptor [Pacificimonas sp. WHA3]|uniref:TonB-dependent receptor n=1 Tax=Pacificimonas pallii TaxID=2827236 RepID=A0ABS6SFF7_9SPHN|nr:TonB-dependent receptor [Pacificimonas pallii]MBV7257139.1 TonB-dependent receptor [Pacificimonas pallii]
MKTLLLSAAPAAFMALLAAPAAAQDDMPAENQASTAAEDDTIVVTGYVLQNRSAIAAKESETRIADFLTQDELGRQPDLNVADSLRRLPGVVTIFDEDEGRYVGLRGLDQRYTFISIDGGLIASTDRSDRDINIESIPPTAVKRLEVFKSITPDLDGQSVGGVINLVTRSAFDATGLYAVANAQLGIHESIGDLPQSFDNPSYRVDAALSSTFGNGDWGFLIAGTYFDKKRDQGRPILGSGANDTGVVVNQVLPLDYSNQIVRWNVLGKLEFQPSDDVYLGVTASHFNYKYDEVRYRLDIFERDLFAQNANGGQFASGSGRTRFDRFPLEQQIQNLNAHLDVFLTERGRLELTASYSNGLQEHPYPNASWQTANLPGFGYTYDLTTENIDKEQLPTVTLNDFGVLSDYDAFVFREYFDGYFENEEDVFEMQGDYAWNMDGPDAGLGFQIGAKYRLLDKRRFDRSTRYTLTDPGGTLPLADFVDPAISPYTEAYLPGLLYPVIDADRFDAFFTANPGLFTGTDASNLRAFYDIEEEVTAAYGMIGFSQGRHHFLGGVRYERTDVDTAATLNGGPDRVFRSQSYDHWLPSALYTFDISHRMRLRAGYAQAVGRPNHPELAGAETFDEANLTIRRANPGLRPRESQSFDVAFDFFIDEGQYLSAAAFHKIIDNQISTDTFEEVIGGQTFTVTRPINIGEVKVSGIELSYTDDRFDFLPAPFDGLGIAANFTYLDGENGPAPGGNLLAQPDFLVNIAGLYTYGPFSAKLTYNYVDDRPTSETRAEYRYEQLDAQIRFQLTDNFQLQAEARNLLNEPRKNIFTDTGRTREINDFGNSYWFGLAYSY